MAAHQLRLGALRVGAALAIAVAAAGAAVAAAAAAAAVDAAENPLRGTTWAADAAASPSLRLDPTQSRLSGLAGCNRISGNFGLAGERLVFGAMASTRRACVPDDGAEERFLKALAEVRRWRINSGALQLLDEAGATLLTLHAAPARP